MNGNQQELISTILDTHSITILASLPATVRHLNHAFVIRTPPMRRHLVFVSQSIARFIDERYVSFYFQLEPSSASLCPRYGVQNHLQDVPGHDVPWDLQKRRLQGIEQELFPDLRVPRG